MIERQPSTAFGPGRVNVLGEHTDYNGGLALPFAIARGVTVTATPIAGDRVEAHARDLGEEDAFPVAAPGPAGGWRAFVRGMVAELGAAGHPPPPVRLDIAGDLPLGAGLASSAALETALCLALLAVAGEPPPEDRMTLARLCSRVEHEWVGAQTGLLDQLASLLGEDGHALLVDFRSLRVERIALRLGGWRLVTVDSDAAHDNAGPGYAARREECRRATEALGLESLRDATLDDAGRLRGDLARRARHVVTENARVQAAAEALRHGDVPALGPLLDASHASLRDDFEASVPEVEATVERLRRAGAAGARMVGGGFGGSVLALLAPGVPVPPGAVEVAPSAGARLVDGAALP